MPDITPNPTPTVQPSPSVTPVMGQKGGVVTDSSGVAKDYSNLQTGISNLDASTLTPDQLAARAGVPVTQIIPNPVGMGYIVGPSTPVTGGGAGPGDGPGAGGGGQTYDPSLYNLPAGATIGANGVVVNSGGVPIGNASDFLKPPAAGGTPGTPAAPTPPTFGKYTADQQAQIDAAGAAAKAQYDALIQQAQTQKAQGMGQALVGAGERGGFLNTQFAGQAARTPVQGGGFVGAGGQLESIQSSYDQNIQQLQIQQQAAIQQAKMAAQQFIETGKQQDFQNAQTAYEDAVTAANNAATLAFQKAQTTFDLSQPMSATTNPDMAKWYLGEIQKYPEIIQAAGGYQNLAKMNYDQFSSLLNQDPSFKAAQIKAGFGTGNYGEWQQAHFSGDFPGTYQQWLAANKQAQTIQISGPGSLAESRQALTLSRTATAVNAVIKALYPTTANNPINMYDNGVQWVNKLQAAYTESTDPNVSEKGPSDLELIDAAVKINNGGQQITETQVNSLLNSMSIPGRAQVAGGKIIGIGAILNDGQRKTIKDLAEKTLSGQEKLAKTAVDQINQRLTRQGFSKDQLLTDPLDAATYMNLANTSGGVTINGTSYSAGQQITYGNLTLTVMADGTLSGSDGNIYDETGNQIN